MFPSLALGHLVPQAGPSWSVADPTASPGGHIRHELQHHLSKTHSSGLTPPPTLLCAVLAPSAYCLHQARCSVNSCSPFISLRQVFIDHTLFAHQTDLPFQTLAVLASAARCLLDLYLHTFKSAAQLNKDKKGCELDDGVWGAFLKHGDFVRLAVCHLTYQTLPAPYL